MGKRFKQLKYIDRLHLEDLLKAKHGVSDIARRLGVSRQTIYNEMKRGEYIRWRKSDYKDEKAYSADIAETKYQEGLKVRGTELKIGNDYALASYIENKIANEHYSPAAVIAEMREQHVEFKTSICAKTVYNYIDKGVFLHLTNIDLPIKGKRKQEYKRVRVVKERKREVGKSIDERPEEVQSRENIGHWEMDTVVGARGKSKHSLLVLTERVTRKEIIRILEQHTAACVVSALDDIERQMGFETFRQTFKSITSDNGTEFAYDKGIVRSVTDETKVRTKIFYCHPYSSWERGSNEVANRLIRRHIPKGINFDNKTVEDIQQIEDWMNNYPRRLFRYKSANQMYLAATGRELQLSG